MMPAWTSVLPSVLPVMGQPLPTMSGSRILSRSEISKVILFDTVQNLWICKPIVRNKILFICSLIFWLNPNPQCCGAGAGRSRTFCWSRSRWKSFGSGLFLSGSRGTVLAIPTILIKFSHILTIYTQIEEIGTRTLLKKQNYYLL